MDRIINRIKQEWDANPLNVIIVATVVVGTAAKAYDSYSAAQGRRAYAKQVDYRVKSRL